jgi:hypothetical protein
MPGIVQQRRKRPSEQLSDDDENSDASSSGSKRPRFTRDASVEVKLPSISPFALLIDIVG